MSAPKTIVNAETSLLSYLLYKGQFEVPWHQRSYDWKKEEVRELLEDIDEAIQAKRECYFLGAVMLVKKPDAHAMWEINDGQQRMVTFSLMCARLARRFTKGEDPVREGYALRVPFVLDQHHTMTLDDTAAMTPRLCPPKDNQAHYYPLIRGGDIGTNGKLTMACQVIDNHFDGMDLAQAQRFFDFVRNKLEVACLYVPRSIDPNAVFETLNARGKSLEALDLIRNYLYSYFGEEGDEARKNTVHQRLESLQQQLSRKAPDYVRCFFQSRYGFIPSTRLYRETKKRISAEHTALLPTDAADSFVYDLAREISRSERVQLFHQITDPSEEDELVRRFLTHSGEQQNPRNLYASLMELKVYKVAQPIVFALLDRYVLANQSQKREVAKVVHRKMRLLSSFVMRTASVTRKFEPSDFERGFSELARRLMSADASAGAIEAISMADALRDADELGVFDDQTFIQKLTTVSFSDKAKARRFLLGLAHYQQPGSTTFNDQHYTLEHILPASSVHLRWWPNFDEDTHRVYATRIGNLALLSRDDNKPGAVYNQSFAKKQDIYGQSTIELTRQVAERADWSPDEIKRRQKRLAELAARVWALPSA